VAKSTSSSDSGRLAQLSREHGVRDTINITRLAAEVAHWTGPVSFKDLDLTKYSVIITKVVDGARMTFFAKRDATVAYFLAEGNGVQKLTDDKLEPVIRLSQILLDAAARQKMKEYLSRGGELDGEGCAIVVAKGKAPKDGTDSKLTWPCGEPQDFGAGKDKGDGSVDYRERQSFIHVKPGDHILSVTPPTKGEAGFDYKGTRIPCRDGEWVRPLAGANVRSEGQSQNELYATIEGVMDLSGGRVHVKPMLQVVRVDFSTGNIRYSGDVAVSTGVEPGFEIEAAGMAQAGGDVMQAKVSGEHVFIGGRMVGSEILARGMAELHVTENSKIRANQGVTILADAVNVTVDCGGRLSMPQHKLVGGKINALGGVEAGWIGGSNGDATHIRIEPESCLLPSLDAITTQLAEKQTAVDKLNAGLAPIKAGGQAAINKLPAQQRDAVKQLMDKASAMEFEIDVLKSQRKKAMEPLLANMRPVIQANQGISDGVKVTIKGVSWSCPERKEGPHKITLNREGNAIVCERA